MHKKWLILFVVISSVMLFFVILKSRNNKPVVVENKPPILEKVPVTRSYSFEDALASISLDSLKKNLYYLASDELEGRMSGKKGNKVAAEFIEEWHKENGLPVEYQKFSIQRMNPGPHNEQGDNFTQNIFGWIEGSDPVLKDEIVVVGAHMDHIGYGPSMSRSRQIAIHNGADDNASGTVVVMEVAKALSLIKNKIPRTIVFQHYSAEEMGLIGSRYYCDHPTFPKSKPDPSNARTLPSHVVMINLDMVGYLNRGFYFTGFQVGDSSVDVGRYINELNGKYSFAKKITSRGSGGSDHACFYNKRVPIAFLHTGSHQHYHTPTDDADRINYEGLTEVAKYTFELVYKAATDDSRPTFNHSSFREMEYNHDHGHPDVPFYHHYHK